MRAGSLSALPALVVLAPWVLGGCPLLAGIDSTYSSGGPGSADAASDIGVARMMDTGRSDTSLARDTGDSKHDGPGAADAPITLPEAGIVDAKLPLPDVAVVDAATCGAGFQCVEAVPTGWTGPVILSDQTGGPPTPTPPACPTAYPTDAFDGYLSPTAAPAACSCSCGAIEGLTCDQASLNVVLYSDGHCDDQCGDDAVAFDADGFCVGTGCSGAGSVLVDEPAPLDGSCMPSLVQKMSPTMWGETARACQPTTVSLGCIGDGICVPVAEAPPFEPQICILQAGDVPCPPGYPMAKVFYASVTDTRACSACTCALPDNLSCSGGSVKLASDSACGVALAVVPADGNCYMVASTGNVFAESESALVTPTGGECTPSNTEASGSVMPSAPTTICCQPSGG